MLPFSDVPFYVFTLIMANLVRSIVVQLAVHVWCLLASACVQLVTKVAA